MKRLKLVAFDLDGTLVKGSSIWRRLHVRFGTESAAKTVMDDFFAGRITYAQWAQRDSALWAGQPLSAVCDEVERRSALLDGAAELAQALAAAGLRVAIVSGGLDLMARSAARRLGCVDPADVLSNTLGVDARGERLDGTCVARVTWDNKGELLAALAARCGVDLRDVCFVGDGENDVFAFAVAGHSVAINAESEKVNRAADHAVRCSDLRALLPLLLPPARLVLMRHAHGEHNAARERLQSVDAYLSEQYRDAPLTALGREQAVSARKTLSESGFDDPDVVYSSPLCRCITTAMLAFSGRRMIADDRLLERLGKHPCNHRGTVSSILAAHGTELVDVSRLPEEAPWPGCFEPATCVRERMQRFVEETLSRMQPGEVAVAVSSYEAILHYTGKALGNCGMTVCERQMYRPWQPWIDLTEADIAAVTAAEAAQAELHSKARALVDSFPRTGVYPGETDEQWQAFLPHVLGVFDKEEGERGEAKRLARAGMHQAAAELAPAFEALGCSADTPIEAIVRSFEKMPRGKVWSDLEKLRKRIDTLECAVASLAFRDSMISRQIVEGLTAKVGEAEALEQLGDITAQRIRTLAQLRDAEAELVAKLATDAEHQLRSRVQELLGPFIALWNTADSKMGHDSNVRGATLEAQSRDLAVRLVMKRIGLQRARVLSNVSWHEVPGEADIVLIDADGAVAAIIEQKANLFDVAEAFEQSGPGHRLRQGKIKLVPFPGETLEVGDNVPCFVVSLIPPHNFNLGFETRLRERLNKLLTDAQRVLSPAEILTDLRVRFSDRVSPAEWLQNNAQTSLILV